MMVMFERMLQEQCVMSEVTVAVNRLVQQNNQFDGKNVTRYIPESLTISLVTSIVDQLMQQNNQFHGKDVM